MKVVWVWKLICLRRNTETSGNKRVSSSQVLLIKCIWLIDHQEQVLAVCWFGAFRCAEGLSGESLLYKKNTTTRFRFTYLNKPQDFWNNVLWTERTKMRTSVIMQSALFHRKHSFSIIASSHSWSRGTGAYPTYCEARGRVHPGQIASPSQE